MFIKPYRPLLLDNSIKSHKAWLDKDIASVPPYIMTSLLEHVDNIKSDSIRYHITPVLKQLVSRKKPPDVSFKIAGTPDFMLRDLAFGETIVKSLLEKQMFDDFDDAIKSFFDRLLSIDHFLNGRINRDFDRTYMEGNVRYHKSFVIGLIEEASSVHDIEYVDIFFDDQHGIIPTTKPLNLCPEVVSRTGISLRFYLSPADALFKLERETVNCSSVGDDDYIYNTITDHSAIMRTTFITNSTEYYFETYYKDIDSILIKYLENHKEKLTARLGYEPRVIDKDILKVIEMAVI
jgi:hypothetical protein